MRDLSRQPVFQAMLALQNVAHEAVRLSGLQVSRLGGERRTAKLDLSLYVYETAQGLRGELEYAADLFDEATIERLAGHLQVLLAGIVADPERRLSELPLLSAAERHQLVEEWNDTAAAYPSDKPVGPEDILATIYHGLGISPEAEIRDSLGRPYRLVEGRPITELFG